LPNAKRLTLTLLAALCMFVSLVVAVALAGGRPTLQLRRTSLGTILVDSQGYTLYTFSKDHRNQDACVKIPGCLGLWPALVSSRPSAGAGVRRSLIGTIQVKGVGRQVTYDGHALYTYIGDNHAAETGNIDVYQNGGYWPAIAAGGRSIK
jgi:predicted lipoprotein with Yx(FWY)xxD motif